MLHGSSVAAEVVPSRSNNQNRTLTRKLQAGGICSSEQKRRVVIFRKFISRQVHGTVTRLTGIYLEALSNHRDKVKSVPGSVFVHGCGALGFSCYGKSSGRHIACNGSIGGHTVTCDAPMLPSVTPRHGSVHSKRWICDSGAGHSLGRRAGIHNRRKAGGVARPSPRPFFCSCMNTP